jgi:hypothetical protein
MFGNYYGRRDTFTASSVLSLRSRVSGSSLGHNVRKATKGATHLLFNKYFNKYLLNKNFLQRKLASLFPTIIVKILGLYLMNVDNEHVKMS